MNTCLRHLQVNEALAPTSSFPRPDSQDNGHEHTCIHCLARYGLLPTHDNASLYFCSKRGNPHAIFRRWVQNVVMRGCLSTPTLQHAHERLKAREISFAKIGLKVLGWVQNSQPQGLHNTGLPAYDTPFVRIPEAVHPRRYTSQPTSTFFLQQ